MRYSQTQDRGVSIHTPTKGVTSFDFLILMFNIVSIHTPTKGVTVLSSYIYRTLIVSIHTPTKGVTSGSATINTELSGFNPHTHEGCDANSNLKM